METFRVVLGTEWLSTQWLSGVQGPEPGRGGGARDMNLSEMGASLQPLVPGDPWIILSGRSWCLWLQV